MAVDYIRAQRDGIRLSTDYVKDITENRWAYVARPIPYRAGGVLAGSRDNDTLEAARSHSKLVPKGGVHIVQLASSLI